ncbi:MAG: hypothetical protein LBJ10_10070 [Clostridiales bacterium]|nr:hypothetical protein [Clostridiales bacterium]
MKLERAALPGSVPPAAAPPVSDKPAAKAAATPRAAARPAAAAAPQGAAEGAVRTPKSGANADAGGGAANAGNIPVGGGADSANAAGGDRRVGGKAADGGRVGQGGADLFGADKPDARAAARNVRGTPGAGGAGGYAEGAAASAATAAAEALAEYGRPVAAELLSKMLELMRSPHNIGAELAAFLVSGGLDGLPEWAGADLAADVLCGRFSLGDALSDLESLLLGIGAGAASDALSDNYAALLTYESVAGTIGEIAGAPRRPLHGVAAEALPAPGRTGMYFPAGAGSPQETFAASALAADGAEGQEPALAPSGGDAARQGSDAAASMAGESAPSAQPDAGAPSAQPDADAPSAQPDAGKFAALAGESAPAAQPDAGVTATMAGGDAPGAQAARAGSGAPQGAEGSAPGADEFVSALSAHTADVADAAFRALLGATDTGGADAAAADAADGDAAAADAADGDAAAADAADAADGDGAADGLFRMSAAFSAGLAGAHAEFAAYAQPAGGSALDRLFFVIAERFMADRRPNGGAGMLSDILLGIPPDRLGAAAEQFQSLSAKGRLRGKAAVLRLFGQVRLDASDAWQDGRLDAKKQYGQLLTKLSLLRAASEMTPFSGKDALEAKISALEDGLRAIDSLNGQHQYMQAPFQINGENTACELYVMRRGKRKKISADDATLFVSLGTANIGRIEALIRLTKNKNVSMSLRAGNGKILDMFRDSHAAIHQALSRRGFRLGRVSYKLAERADGQNGNEKGNDGENGNVRARRLTPLSAIGEANREFNIDQAPKIDYRI